MIALENNIAVSQSNCVSVKVLENLMRKTVYYAFPINMGAGLVRTIDLEIRLAGTFF